jgi:hypothetical protein
MSPEPTRQCKADFRNTHFGDRLYHTQKGVTTSCMWAVIKWGPSMTFIPIRFQNAQFAYETYCSENDRIFFAFNATFLGVVGYRCSNVAWPHY